MHCLIFIPSKEAALRSRYLCVQNAAYIIFGRKNNMEKMVVIGGNAAGMSAAAKARRGDAGIAITVFERSGFVTAISAYMTVYELNELDLAYAPSVSPVYDPILIAAAVGIKAIKNFKKLTR
jgi:hypothetical protein